MEGQHGIFWGESLYLGHLSSQSLLQTPVPLRTVDSDAHSGTHLLNEGKSAHLSKFKFQLK